MKPVKLNLILTIAICSIALIFTILVATLDVQPAGPDGVMVGFSALNHDVATAFPFNKTWYQITGSTFVMAPLLAIPLFYTALGIAQFIKRGKVKKELFALAGFYLAIAIIYILFEKLLILNYRPVLLGGPRESSYPSSHTLFSICFCGSAILINQKLFPKTRYLKFVNLALALFACFVVIGRFLSGVHWLTDIVGGIIISAALLTAFYFVLNFLPNHKSKKATK